MEVKRYLSTNKLLLTKVQSKLYFFQLHGLLKEINYENCTKVNVSGGIITCSP